MPVSIEDFSRQYDLIPLALKEVLNRSDPNVALGIDTKWTKVVGNETYVKEQSAD
jgi:hypothetical protein